MPTNSRAIKQRIRSVSSTKQITKAMELVAAARLHRAIEEAHQALLYCRDLEDVALSLLKQTDEPLKHEWLVARPIKKVLLFAVTSNQGLAGSYNANVWKAVKAQALEEKAQGHEVVISGFGRKLRNFVRHSSFPWHTFSFTLPRQPAYQNFSQCAAELGSAFSTEIFDEVRLVYTHYKSGLIQEVKIEPLLPFHLESRIEDSSISLFVHEPSPQSVLDQALPQLLSAQLFTAYHDALASELANRRRAMHTATDNAGTIISDLRLLYNRARQSAVTTEIAEITGGAAALR